MGGWHVATWLGGHGSLSIKERICWVKKNKERRERKSQRERKKGKGEKWEKWEKWEKKIIEVERVFSDGKKGWSIKVKVSYIIPWATKMYFTYVLTYQNLFYTSYVLLVY